MKNEVKTCPFCGTMPEYSHSGGAAQIWCPNSDCELIGFVDSNSPYMDDVISKWNTRVNRSEHSIENGDK